MAGLDKVLTPHIERVQGTSAEKHPEDGNFLVQIFSERTVDRVNKVKSKIVKYSFYEWPSNTNSEI